MWKQVVHWTVEWSGKTLWDSYYSDQKEFGKQDEARIFYESLQADSNVHYIAFKEIITCTREKK